MRRVFACVLYVVLCSASAAAAPPDSHEGVAYLTREQALGIFFEAYLPTNENAETAAAFLFQSTGPDSLLPPETVVSSSDSSFSVTLETPSYLFWVDNEPQSEWLHPTEFVIMDALEGGYTVYPSEGWPTLNGEEYLQFTEDGNESPDLILGGYASLAPLYPYTTVPRTNDKDWAVLVVSRNLHGDREKRARKNDINRVKEILNGADLGPKLSPENITVVPGPDTLGATTDEVCAALAALKGKKCRKLYFFYLGHGARTGRMVLRDKHFSYDDLADKLAAVDAQEFCIVIEACYSGSSFKALAKKRRYKVGKKTKTRSLTGVAVSSSPKRYTTTRQGDGTPFYKGLNACFKDPTADLNKDMKVTILEAVAWAAATNPDVAADDPQGKLLKKYTTSEPRVDFLPKSYTYTLDQMKFELICACYKVKKRGTDKICRKALYVENTGSRERDMSDYEVVCLKGTSGKRPQGDPHTFTQKLPPRQAGKQAQRVCLGEMPLDCKRFLVRLKEGGAPALATTIATGPGIYSQTVECRPGEFIFDGLELETGQPDEYLATIQGPASWDLSIDPESFTLPVLQDTALVFVRGTFPETAMQGDRFQTALIDLTDPDTSRVEFNVLLFDSLEVAVEGGTQVENMSYDVFQGVEVLSDTATVRNSVLNVKTDVGIFVGSGGYWNLEQSCLQPDSLGAFSFSVSGGLNWDHSQVSLPQQGITLDSPHGSLVGGGVYGSEDDGIKCYGDFSDMEMGFFTVEQSAINGLYFEGASACTLNAVRILDSTENDVALAYGSEVHMVDCTYDSTKESADETSTLTRSWSTTLVVYDKNGVPIPGVDVEILDGASQAVALGMTDADGITPSYALTQYVHDGAGLQNADPYTVHLQYDALDTMFVTAPRKPQVLVIDWKSVALTPVRLAALEVERTAEGAVLTRSVADAHDHLGFRVYRENAGRREELTAALLRGLRDYRYVDPSPPPGEARYWLAEMSRSGKLTWYGPVVLPDGGLPSHLAAGAGYPNPFRAGTRVLFTVPDRVPVRAEVFDIQGRRMSVLLDTVLPAGRYQAAWDGRQASGSRAPAGMYFLRIQAGSERISRKVVLAAGSP